jgi:hypothetical protein
MRPERRKHSDMRIVTGVSADASFQPSPQARRVSHPIRSARGLAHSTTLRASDRPSNCAPASWSAAVFRRFGRTRTEVRGFGGYFAARFQFLSLAGSSTRICSHGIPPSGLWLNRPARRSASSSCSGDKSSSGSPNSSLIWPVTLRRSFSGMRRICSKISVALMQRTVVATRPTGRFVP